MRKSIIKSVSLDEETAILADEKTNFSKFVRNALRRDLGRILKPGSADHVTPAKDRLEPCPYFGEIKLLCNPIGAIRCVKCWPDGTPDSEAWLAYLNAIRSPMAARPGLGRPQLEAEEELRSGIALLNFEDEPTLEVSAKPEPRSGLLGWLRRVIS